jgi:hypothetical protein
MSIDKRNIRKYNIPWTSGRHGWAPACMCPVSLHYQVAWIAAWFFPFPAVLSEMRTPFGGLYSSCTSKGRREMHEFDLLCEFCNVIQQCSWKHPSNFRGWMQLHNGADDFMDLFNHFNTILFVCSDGLFQVNDCMQILYGCLLRQLWKLIDSLLP